MKRVDESHAVDDAPVREVLGMNHAHAIRGRGELARVSEAREQLDRSGVFVARVPVVRVDEDVRIDELRHVSAPGVHAG